MNLYNRKRALRIDYVSKSETEIIIRKYKDINKF